MFMIFSNYTNTCQNRSPFHRPNTRYKETQHVIMPNARESGQCGMIDYECPVGNGYY